MVTKVTMVTTFSLTYIYIKFFFLFMNALTYKKQVRKKSKYICVSNLVVTVVTVVTM